jgi:hypothetical protein
MALVFALPAAAQTAPATDHSQHGQMDKMQMSAAEHAAHIAGGEKHECPRSEGGKKMACCEHAKDECPETKTGKAMACCDHDSHAADAHAAHGDHGGH